MDQKKPPKQKSWARGATRPPQGWRACPPSLSSPCGPLDLFPTPKIPINIATPRNKPRSGVSPPQASVATENQSRLVLAPCQRGESLSGGHLHHPGALHDEEGVVHPRG